MTTKPQWDHQGLVTLAGGSKPAEHWQLIKEYFKKMRQHRQNATTFPAQNSLYTELMDLAAHDPFEDYANQVKLQAIASGPDAQAATALQAYAFKPLNASACRLAMLRRSFKTPCCVMDGPIRLTP